MKKPKLSLLNFLKIVPDRVEKIENAPDKEPKPSSSYKANELAASLHPAVQYLTVSAITKLSDDVKLFRLTPGKAAGTKRLAPFGAGQYISVTVNAGGCTYSRPYSIASSPLEAAEFYEIAVKRVKDGIVSNYIHENWTVGTAVTASDPCGEFGYEPLRDAKTVVCAAGGVGITPFCSMAKAINEGSESFDMVLLYCARKEEDLIFKSEFDAMSGVKVVYVLSDEEKPGFEHGFADAGLIKKYAPDGDFSLFVCGPKAMYKFVGSEAKKLGLRRKFVRKEVQGEPTDPQNEPDYEPADKESYTVTVMQNGTVKTVVCGADEPILRALERGGVSAPSRCRSGECGFCHSRLVSGRCYTPASCDGRREADKIYGYIHPCIAFPREDITIEVPPAR
ncbi:MAG: 2Fe-2S iron-sulfur cluster binding domain-containing protein [Clostridia bacterium]|nr:2Fe-2S iron-sulfur cluster binding domain-containing protein [Clostridia bacterium]